MQANNENTLTDRIHEGIKTFALKRNDISNYNKNVRKHVHNSMWKAASHATKQVKCNK